MSEKKKRPRKGSKGRAGRPRIEFDLTIVEGLGRIGATAVEMAAVLPASQSTIEHRLADKDSDFSKVYRKGRALLNSSQRRKQIQVAMAGNPTLLIWLGKQLLRQHDRHEVSTPSGTALLIKRAHALADEMTDEEARALLAQATRGPLMGGDDFDFE